MPKAHDKFNVLDLTETRRAAYRRYLISKGKASRIMKFYHTAEEASRNAGIAGL